MHLDPQGSIEGVFWRAHFSSRACVPYLNKLATSKFVSLPDLWDSTCRRKSPPHLTLMKHFTLFIALAVGVGALDSHAQIFNPTKRVMVEDHTTGGAWFGWWSPRGIVHLEHFMMETPATDYEVACIHGNNGADYEYGNFDAMFLASYSTPAANTDLMTGWPCFLLDRKTAGGYETSATLPVKHDSLSSDFGYANLTIEPLFESSLRNLSVTVDAHFAVAVENFRLAVVLTEDSVHRPGENGYSQTNAYNFINGDAADVPMASSSVDFNAHGPVVLSTFMTFRHVARAILPSYEGDPESLPASVEADGVYSYTFPTHFISEDFDETKMRAIALLIDASTGEIVNCLGARFNESQTSSVDAPVPTREVTAKLFPNPTAHTTTLQFEAKRTQQGILQIMDANGRIVRSEGVVANPGLNQVDIDVSRLNAGVYVVEINADGHSMVSERLLVEHP